MRNRNLMVLGISAVLILVVVLFSFLPQSKRVVETISDSAPIETAQPVQQPVPDQTEEPAETAASDPQPLASEKPVADAYLLVTVAGMLYEPIPIYEETDYTVRRGEMENVIHVTPDSVSMKSSTCDNQDCVLQGTVSLENMTKRVLGNMIICLPNEVTLELYTPEGLAELVLQMEGAQ